MRHMWTFILQFGGGSEDGDAVASVVCCDRGRLCHVSAVTRRPDMTDRSQDVVSHDFIIHSALPNDIIYILKRICRTEGI